MQISEEQFSRYLDIIQSSATDEEVEVAQYELGIEPGILDHEQNRRLRDARLERARARAIEKELAKKSALLSGPDLPVVTPSGTMTKKRKPTRILGIVFIAIILGALIYLVAYKLDGSICRTKCCDGTCSPSTGQGTCSYHGGICND